MAGTAFCLPPLPVLYLVGRKRLLERYVRSIARFWSRHFLGLVGATVVLKGTENLPAHDRMCFIANHQSIFDILLILGYSGKEPGFIAKKELAVFPVMNIWMIFLHCVFIERKNIKKALKAIDRGVESLKAGNPMAIFPEGTRSRDGKMRPFKAGSIKLATRSEADIIPVTIDGSFRLYERTGRFSQAEVILTIHPPIPTAGLSPEEKKGLSNKIEEIIGSALPPESRIEPEKVPS